MKSPKNSCRLLSLLLTFSLLWSVGALAADTDIVITEIMQNPSSLLDDVGEWFEVHNTGLDEVDFDGWTFMDAGSNTHTVSRSVTVPAGGYAVFARDSTAMAGQGVTAVYEYGSSLVLANSDDELILLNVAAAEIDRVEYDGGPVWPDPTGASMMWDESSDDNNVGTNWTESTVAFGSGDFGTPGAANGGPALQDPYVNNVYHRSIFPAPGQAVTVTADATDSDGTVTQVLLYTQVNGGGFSSQAMTLDSGDTYTATLAGGTLGDVVDYYVEATDNNSLTSTNPADAPTSYYTYTVANEVLTDIATIHADSLAYADTWVKIQAQVYIPGDYKADGTSVSAYVQNTLGRGLNIFGTTRSTGSDLLNDTTNIVKISGRVVWHYATVELVNYEVELLSTGNPVLTPDVQTTADAAALTNEGSYIGSAGPITAIATTGGSNPAYNFTINDGSGDVVIRVDEDIVASLDTWLVGDQLVAAGAGGSYTGAGQIIVGLASDLTNNGQGPDVTAPTLSAATLTAGTEVTLQFDEAIDAVSGNTAGNYEIFETATPGNTIAVSGAVVQANASVVILTLGADASGIAHTVRINNVEDLAGNPIAANTTANIIEPGVAVIVINEIMNNPDALSDTVGEWFEVYNAGVDAVDMNGWTISDDGSNLHVIDNGGPLVINPGEYKVFVRNAATLAGEGITAFYQYSNCSLGNSDDELILSDTGAVVVDRVAWDNGDTFPDPTGASMQWTGIGDNADGTTWDWTGPIFGSGDRGTPGAVNDVVSPVPDANLSVTKLGRNYPNPFNPVTTFSFTLARNDHVRLQVFDVRGHLVRNVVDANLTAGQHGSYQWDGKNNEGASMNSGTYFYRLETGSGYVRSQKMTLIK